MGRIKRKIKNSPLSKTNKKSKDNTPLEQKNNQPNPKGLTLFDAKLRNKKNRTNIVKVYKKINARQKKFDGKIEIVNENDFNILSIKKKQKYSFWKNNFSILSKKRNNFEIDEGAKLSFTEKNKSNDSLLTQETSENLNFSFISKITNTPKQEIIKSKEKNKKGNIIELPDKPKGLNNFSLNCYMNSLLQCFYHIRGMRTSFIDPTKFDEETQKVCRSLSEVMKGLTYGDENYYSPNKFKQTLGDINSLFKGCKGADVSDLYRTVIDSIIDEIPYEYPDDEDYENKKQNYEEAKKEVDPNNPINKILNYFYETIYKCPEGNNIYSVQNDSSIMFELLKISTISNDKIDLYKCFDYNFREIQNNQFYCSKCCCTHTNTSRDKLLSLPKVLTLILNRGKGKQFVDKVDFDETINIQKYVDDTFIKPKNRKYNYKLIGVSTHLGSSSNCGHYIAYCFREKENQYFCFNDEYARMISFDELKHGEPYILFYEQIDEITTPTPTPQ